MRPSLPRRQAERRRAQRVRRCNGRCTVGSLPAPREVIARVRHCGPSDTARLHRDRRMLLFQTEAQGCNRAGRGAETARRALDPGTFSSYELSPGMLDGSGREVNEEADPLGPAGCQAQVIEPRCVARGPGNCQRPARPAPRGRAPVSPAAPSRALMPTSSHPDHPPGASSPRSG